MDAIEEKVLDLIMDQATKTLDSDKEFIELGITIKHFTLQSTGKYQVMEPLGTEWIFTKKWGCYRMPHY